MLEESRLAEIESCTEPGQFLDALQAVVSELQDDCGVELSLDSRGVYTIQIQQWLSASPRTYRLRRDGKTAFNPGDDPNLPDAPEC